MAPDLMNIPPEVQNLIGGHVSLPNLMGFSRRKTLITFRSQLHISDLNSVSRTCKTLNNAFLAKLYSRVLIRVPIRWSRLASLENLVASFGNGLKFTTTIFIAALQQSSNGETLESEDDRTPDETAEEEDLLFCLPSSSASKALNVMIRLLLMRIPDNRLKGFRYVYAAFQCVD